MSRRTIRLAAAGSAVAVTLLAGGTAFAATGDGSYIPQPPPGGGGAGNPPGATGNNGGTGGTGTSFTSNGGSLTSGGGASTTGAGSGSNLPFTGFELVTALTLGIGAIGAGSVMVVSSRRKRDTSALA